LLLLIGAVTQGENLAIVTEYISFGSLYSLNKKCQETKRPLDFCTTLNIAKQVANGLCYLHLRGIIHRDMKPENILIDGIYVSESESSLEILESAEPTDYFAKICDFGLSIIKPPDGEFLEGHRLGSPLFMPPELWERTKYNEKVDTYSFAITMWEVFSNKMVESAEGFGDYLKNSDKTQRRTELKAAICSGKRPKMPSSLEKDVQTMFKAAWDNNPEKRWGMSSVLAILDTVYEKALHAKKSKK